MPVIQAHVFTGRGGAGGLYAECIQTVVVAKSLLCGRNIVYRRRKKESFSGLHSQLATMVGRVEQVAKQTRARVFGGNTKFEEKLVSVFEPQTEIIRKGKTSKPTEFGKLVKLQEAENQIVTHFEVYDERPRNTARRRAVVGIAVLGALR